MKNIVLVGFMGTGKTRVGKLLANQLKWQRLSLDDMIEWKVGKPIAKIFTEDGEKYFRKVEVGVVKAASRDKKVVIDAGGGVVIDEKNVARLKYHGVMFCLTATPEVIYERTKSHNHRPLLNVDDPVAKIDDLLKKRDEFYKRADHIINTSELTPEEVADNILSIMEREDS